MAPPDLPTPAASGTSTPTTKSASALTEAGIKHLLPNSNAIASSTNGNNPTLAPLDSSLLTTNLTTQPRPVPAIGSAEELAQKTCTDHMITCLWTALHGWHAPELKPYGPLSIMPSASVLHYATECFEGMKLYRGYDGRLRLFRPERNAKRMRQSAARIALPDFDPAEFEKLVVALCARDGRKWLPKERAGHFLYLRPTMIATDAALGVQRPKEALLYIILCCFPDMSKSLAAPSAPPALDGTAAPPQSQQQQQQQSHKPSGLKLLASEEDTIRAWPGGFGSAKVGANYGPTLVAQGAARARGFDQVLWLFGEENFVTEAGASNFFVVWRSKESGRLELVTAPLGERIILEGVTRASVLELARGRLAVGGERERDVEGLEVVERRFTMGEVVAAEREGRLVEAFAAGTAFFIAAVEGIHFRGIDLKVPMVEGASGVYAGLVKRWLVGIMYGRTEHEWGVVVEEVEA